MKVLFVRPYQGEASLVKIGLPDREIIFVTDVKEVAEKDLQRVEILSVFVDYQVTKEIIEKFPYLKMIATRSVGYDHIDTEAIKEKGIILTRVPHYGTRTVAEYALALM